MRAQSFISSVLNNLSLQYRQHRVLVLTMLGSIVLHVMLLTEFSINLPQLFESDQTLEMRLVQQQAKTITPPVPDKKIKAEKKHKAVKKESEAKPAPAAESTNPEIIPAADSPVASAANSAQTSPVAGNGTDSSSEGSAADFSGIQEQNEPEKITYTHVETEFEVKRGIDASAVGVTKIVFNIEANGHYSIVSTTQAKGLVSLFFGDLTQKSKGTVTEHGLKPDFYAYQYGNDAKKSQTATFDWVNNVLHMRTHKGDSTANLAAGTQDFLSFMYQFMFTPPLDTMQITMTNGKRLRTYSYSFEGEESIATKLGELKTIHLLKSSGDEEKTELWLATDYQYLPVKIRKTEKNGTVIEQVVANIQTESSN
jgi:hypothetical protein